MGSDYSTVVGSWIFPLTTINVYFILSMAFPFDDKTQIRTICQ